MNRAPHVSFVVPVYNAAMHIEAWKSRLLEVLSALDTTWEVVLVDDGSSDGSWQIISGWAAADSRFRAFGLTRNFGQHPAMTRGLQEARGQVIMTLDDDLQIPHESIPEFLRAIAAGHDVVAGYRVKRRDPFLWRRVPSAILNRFMRAMSGLPRRDFGCNHVAYRRWVIDAVLSCPDRSRFLPELVAWAGGRFTEIAVSHQPGPSRYRYSRLIRLNLELLTQYNFWWLCLGAMMIGVVMVGLGVFSIAFSAVAYHLQGWLEITVYYRVVLLSILVVLSGILIGMAGIIALLVNRLVRETAARPFCVVHPDRIVDRGTSATP